MKSSNRNCITIFETSSSLLSLL